MKKKPKGRPKKKKTEILVNVNVRVSKKAKKTVDSWGKDKGRRLEAAIEHEDAKAEG